MKPRIFSREFKLEAVRLVQVPRGFACAEFGVLQAEARRIATVMGEARNWDVLTGLVQDGPAAVIQEERGSAALLAASETPRAAGYEAVEALLNSVDTTRFVLSALAFVARRGWRNSIPGADLPRLSAPAAGFASLGLDRLHRRVRKRGRHILETPAGERHELRVELKRLRYATDFFGNLFRDASAVRTYARATAKLQDVLGVFNDMVMVAELVQRLQLGDDLATARAAGIVIGWYGRGGRSDGDALRDAKPFWRNLLQAAETHSAPRIPRRRRQPVTVELNQGRRVVRAKALAARAFNQPSQGRADRADN